MVRKIVTYNCGEFHAIVKRKYSKEIDDIVEDFPILRRKDIWYRKIDLSSCGCRADAIREAMEAAGVPFEDHSTPPSVIEREISKLPKKYL